MFSFNVLEVTKENKYKYLEQISFLEEKVLHHMESKGKIGQLFITGKDDIEKYIDSIYNSVLIATNENNDVIAVAYITQNQIPFTYNDITKYFKYGDGYNKYVKSLYNNDIEYQSAMLSAYNLKLKAFEYANAKILAMYPQYNTILEFLEHELHDKQNKFHEKSDLRELVNIYMSKYIEHNFPEYKELYERFYWINAIDIQNELCKSIDMNHLKNARVLEYENFINEKNSMEYTEILENGKLKIYYSPENMEKYYMSNTQNSVEIDTYITDPENRQAGLARILVFEGIKKHIENHFKDPNNKEIFLCSTLHKSNLSSKYVSEFFGLKDNLYVNRRQGRDREVHICQISKEDVQQYLKNMSDKLAILYGYNPDEKVITEDVKISVLQEQLQYEKNEMLRLKIMRKRKGKKFEGAKDILHRKSNKIQNLKHLIKKIRKHQLIEEEVR